MSERFETTMRRAAPVLVILGLALWILWRFMEAPDRDTHSDDRPAVSDAAGMSVDRSAVAALEGSAVHRADAMEKEVDMPAPVGAAVQNKIHGVVQFPHGGKDAPSFETVWVITLDEVHGDGVRRLPADERRAQEFFQIPVSADYSFEFLLPAGTDSISLTAIGPGVTGAEDVLASPEHPCVIPVLFTYALTTSWMDATTGSALARNESLGFLRAHSSSHLLSGGHRGGIRSSLARAFFLPVSNEDPGRFGSVTYAQSEEYVADGLPLSIRVSEPGYQQQSITLQVPLLVDEVAHREIELLPNQEPQCALTIRVLRDLDWVPLESFEYRSFAEIALRENGADLDTQGSPNLKLNDASYRYSRLQFTQPECRYEIGRTLGLARSIERPMGLLTLEADPTHAGDFLTTIDAREFGVLVVRPSRDAVPKKAWVSLQHQSAPRPMGYQYASQLGIVFDAIPPGRYQIFWGGSYADHRAKVEAGLSLVDMEIRPGINEVVVPE